MQHKLTRLSAGSGRDRTHPATRYERHTGSAIPALEPGPGEYAFVEGFSLEKMKLSGAEACLLVLMSDMAASLGNHFGESFSTLKKRLLTVPEDNPFFIKMAHSGTYKDSPLAHTLEECIRARQWVNVCYQGGKKACYPVRPLKIMWMDGFWYLLALAEDDKLLKFRLEKTTSAKEIGNFFKYNKNIDKILKESTNVWFEKERPLSVLLEVSVKCAQYFKDKIYFPLQKVEKEFKDGRIVLSCQAACEEEILPSILHWLPNIKVVSPASLHKRVKEVLNNYLRNVK